MKKLFLKIIPYALYGNLLAGAFLEESETEYTTKEANVYFLRKIVQKLKDTDPNIGPEWGHYPIHCALCHQNLAELIALLQHGAWLNVRTRDTNYPLKLAEEILRGQGYKTYARLLQYDTCVAQYELLKSLSDYVLQLNQVHATEYYTHRGISRKSTKLIQKATQDANEALAQCRLDDWRAEHPGQSLSRFILDRELGGAPRQRPHRK